MEKIVEMGIDEALNVAAAYYAMYRSPNKKAVRASIDTRTAFKKMRF